MWRKEHATAILNAVNEVFADVPISELESSDHDEDEADFDIIDQEWASLRDDPELCQALFESDLMNMDEVMDEIDQSGNEQRSVTSVINNLLP